MKKYFKYKFKYDEERNLWKIEIAERGILGIYKDWRSIKLVGEKITYALGENANNFYDGSRFKFASDYFRDYDQAQEAFDSFLGYYTRFTKLVKQQKQKVKRGIVTEADLLVKAL